MRGFSGYPQKKEGVLSQRSYHNSVLWLVLDDWRSMFLVGFMANAALRCHITICSYNGRG